MTREPVTYVEIVMPFCALEYGVSPCMAEIGVTGTRKCFNTYATCQAKASYFATSKNYLFCTQQSEKIIGAIPSVVSVNTSPTVLNIAGRSSNSTPLGIRATANIVIKDHPDADYTTDPYLSARSYNALTQGTYWSKWLVRNKFFKNRPINIYEGYVGQTLAEMRKKQYIIDTINGVDSSGNVTIRAVDILRLASDDRSQAPAVSRGRVETLLTNSATTLEVEGAVISEYLSAGFIRINKEVIEYTGLSESMGVLTFTGLTRGFNNTSAAEHKVGDTVQQCLEYDNEPVWEVIEDLLTTYAGVDPAFIPSADWATEGANWLTQFNVTTLITEPTGVLKLIEELSEQCLLYIWWDEIRQEIRLRAVRPVTESITDLDDQKSFIAGSFSTRLDPNEQLSQLWFYYLPTTFVEITREQDFERVFVRVDLEAESPNEYDQSRIRKVFSRWIDTDPKAQDVASRLLSTVRDTPRYVTFKLDAKDRALWTGDIVRVSSRYLVDDTGAIEPRIYIIISSEEVESGHILQYTALEYGFTLAASFYMGVDAPDYSAATDEEKANGCWWSDSGGLISGDDGYVYT